MRECNESKNMKSCNCSYEPCSRKGYCCDCVLYHRTKGQLPACFFPDDVEATYDRSFKKFVDTFQSQKRWW